MNACFVSVVMPVYNRERLVWRAIESILQQTYRDFELIVVDDGSTDRTADILASVQDSRVQAIRLPVNTSNSMARNVGVGVAQGDYIAVMDSDDVALPDRLATQVAFMQKRTDVAICGGDAIKVTPKRRIQMKYPEHDAQIKAMLLKVDGAIIHPTAMLRTSFLRENGLCYNPAHDIDSDNALFLDVMRCGGQFQTIRQNVLHYYRHESNLTYRNPQLEPGKTPLRERVLTLFYPELDGWDVRALAALMERGRRLTGDEACHGLGVAMKAARSKTSYFGEDKTRLAQLLNAAARDTLNRLIKSVPTT